MSDFEYVIKPQFEVATRFSSDHYAVVVLNGKKGVIDRCGKFVLDPIFDINQTVCVELGGKAATIDGFRISMAKEDSEILPLQPNETPSLEIPFLETEYEKVFKVPLPNHTYTVKKCGKWGTVDKCGKTVIPFLYDDLVLAIGAGVCTLVTKDADGKYYVQLADYNGNILCEQKFSAMFKFGPNKLAPAKSGRKWGYINTSGEWIIKPQFMYATTFADNQLAAVRSFGYHGKYGYIKQSDR